MNKNDPPNLGKYALLTPKVLQGIQIHVSDCNLRQHGSKLLTGLRDMFFLYQWPLIFKASLSNVEPLRFPTLIVVVAQELEIRDNNCSTVGEFGVN
ncbi:hypothetical protein MTR_2g032750 [Medicago truncatula]|uniref:Uncharacterized protein n=1 Tax=Medicago truncatula TaxID=3880 RepID=G7IL02_MEDTR|nr:hypothetical protein MTR_2g032750 [Medicago truncatula]